MLSLLTTVESLSGLTQSRETSPPVKRAVFQQKKLLTAISCHRLTSRTLLRAGGCWGGSGQDGGRASLACGDNVGEWLCWPKRCFLGLLDPAKVCLRELTPMPELGAVGCAVPGLFGPRLRWPLTGDKMPPVGADSIRARRWPQAPCSAGGQGWPHELCCCPGLSSSQPRRGGL